jgi:hypothetical protein
MLFQDFKTVFVDRRLLGRQCCLSTGLAANGIRLTKRCNALSSRSDVTHGLPDVGKSFTLIGLCVFSHQSTDYSILVAHLTSNSFEGHPCCMHADYLPSLCFWYSPSYHAYWEWIIFLNTGLKYPNSNREHTEFWIMRERHGSREWLVDIRHNGHTCVGTSFNGALFLLWSI